MPISHRRTPLAALLLLLLAPSVARAQDGPRWRAWIGCWSAVAPASTTSSTAEQGSPILCVLPTQDADVVDIAAISDGKVVSRDRLDASGRAQAIDAGGCTGSTRASWSDDRRRVFLRSNVTCQGQASETSAILAMANGGGGEWIDVRSVTAGGNSEVRVARYRDAGLPSSIPSDIASALRDREMSVRSARIASTAPISSRDIIEASRAADPAIVEAWIMESGQRYDVDAGTLRQLADAGVPGRVTDALVSATRGRESDERYASSEERVVPVYDPWGYGNVYRTVAYPVMRYRPVDRYAPVGFSFSLFGFGYAPYGYAYAPFGYYPYAYRPVVNLGFGFGFGYNRPYTRSYHRPVVVVRPPDRPRYDEPREARPRVVRDQGYTQGRREERPTERRYDTGTTRQAVERTRDDRPTRTERTVSRPSQPSQPSQGQPRQGGGEARTAHRRP